MKIDSPWWIDDTYWYSGQKVKVKMKVHIDLPYLVQLITQEHFTLEASILVVRWCSSMSRWSLLIFRSVGRRSMSKVKYCISGIFRVGKFWLFQGLSVKTYSRVYFSLCLFLAISGRSRTQRKLNPCEKFPIYGIFSYVGEGGISV